MEDILDLPEIRARLHRWTVAEYEKLGNSPAFRGTELIRGIIFNKACKSSPLYSMGTTLLYSFLQREMRAEFTVRKDEQLRLADSVLAPDISVLREALVDSNARHPPTAELVVEIAVSSVTGNRENASLYAEAGVIQYWIVLGATEQVEVYRRPLAGIYQERRTYGRGESIENVGVLDKPVSTDTFFT